MVIAAILLAAGDTEIDGVPLALLPWSEGNTLVEYHVAELQTAGVDVIEVVLGYAADRVISLVAQNDVDPIVDPRWHVGEASWLRVGAAAVPRNTACAIILRVDEPRSASLYRRLLAAHDAAGMAITCATVGGLRAWPYVVGSALLAVVRNASDSDRMDAIGGRDPAHVTRVQLESEPVRIETAADYRAARQTLT